MKICPFISHMLGEETADTLTAESAAILRKSAKHQEKGNNVVILGYDGTENESGSIQTQTMPDTSTEQAVFSHLFCLKESCRFYKKNQDACLFDSIFDLTKEKENKAGKEEKEPDSRDEKISKELDKFWNFQTKSVAEMISSIGEAEKNQEKSLNSFKTDLNECIESLLKQNENNSLESLQDEIGKLRDALSERNEVMESHSTTLSEIVENIEDRFSNLNEKIEQFSDKLKKLDKLDNSEKENSSWRDELNVKLKDLTDRQTRWDGYLASLKENQDDLIKFFENDIKRHEVADELLKKKEAKKHNNLGVTSFHNGAYVMAKDQFLRAVELDGESAESYNNLGLAYTELGEEDNATEAFEKAIQLNPELSAAYTNLGYVFYKQGSFEQAVEMYNEALARSLDNSSAYANLGCAYFKLGNIAEAREAWNKALDIDPGNEKAKRFLKRLETEKV